MTCEDAIARNQTNWKRLESMTDEKLIQNALDIQITLL